MTNNRRLAALAMIAILFPLLTVVLRETPQAFSLSNAALIFLLLAVAVSAVGGLVPGLIGVAVAVAILAWYFIPPYHRFTISNSQDVTTLLVFTTVTALTGWLVEQSSRKARELSEARAVAEAAELQSRTNEVRGALLGAVSHDLRTPLASVKVAVTTLLQGSSATSNAEVDLLKPIDRSVDRLEVMVKDLLDTSRIRTGAIAVHMQHVSVEEVLTSVLETRADSLSRIRLEVPDDLPLVEIDPLLTERIVSNLVDNALVFSTGTVDVRARMHESKVELHVIDHGPGVPADKQALLFTPFQRLTDEDETRGVGLGLSIAQGFAHAMSLTLDFTDTPGGGATFLLRIPVNP